MGWEEFSFSFFVAQSRLAIAPVTVQHNSAQGGFKKKNRERPEAGPSIKRAQEAMEDRNDRDLLS